MRKLVTLTGREVFACGMASQILPVAHFSHTSPEMRACPVPSALQSWLYMQSPSFQNNNPKLTELQIKQQPV